MCRDGITCIGLIAMAWPVGGLAAIGCIYLWRFVTVTRRNKTPTLAPPDQRIPLGRFHNRKHDNG